MEKSGQKYDLLASQIISINLGAGVCKEKFLFASQADQTSRLLVSCDFGQNADELTEILNAGVDIPAWTSAQELLRNPETQRHNLDGSSPNMRVIAQVPIVGI